MFRNANARRGLIAASVTSVVLLQGCATWGDVLIPRHPKSGLDSRDVVCVSVKQGDAQNSAGTIVALLAKPAISWAYDKVVSAVETEAGRYKASYSGRNSVMLYTKVSDDEASVINKIVVKRFMLEGDQKVTVGSAVDVCSQSQLAPVFRAEYDVESLYLKDVNVFEARIKPIKFTVLGTKAKALGKSWSRPWSVLANLDHRYAKVDMSVRLKLSAAVYGDDGKRTEKDVITADFPIGKINLNAEHVNANYQGNPSAWVQLPAVGTVPGSNCKFAADAKKGDKPTCTPELLFGPATIEATVSESDELGDVLSKQVTNAKEKKDKTLDDLIQKIKDKL